MVIQVLAWYMHTHAHIRMHIHTHAHMHTHTHTTHHTHTHTTHTASFPDFSLAFQFHITYKGLEDLTMCP